MRMQGAAALLPTNGGTSINGASKEKTKFDFNPLIHTQIEEETPPPSLALKASTQPQLRSGECPLKFYFYTMQIRKPRGKDPKLIKLLKDPCLKSKNLKIK